MVKPPKGDWKKFVFESDPPVELYAHDTGHMTRAEWLGFRSSCDQPNAPSIGGSELGTVCGWDDYKDALILFYEKIGLKEVMFTQNQYTANGILFESNILNKWKHWDGKDWFPSWVSGTKHRDGADLHKTLWNPEIPWFFMNVDGVIFEDPEYSDQFGWGIAEVKTIGGHYADRLEIGFPWKYMYQVQGYMMGCGAHYANLIMQVDLKRMDVFSIAPHQETRDIILDKCGRFVEAVKKGRKVMASKKDKAWKMRAIFDIEEEYADILYVSASEKLGQLLSKVQQEKNQLDEREAPEFIIEKVLRHESLKEEINKLTEEKKLIANEIKKEMTRESVRKYWWENGTVSFFKKLSIRT